MNLRRHLACLCLAAYLLTGCLPDPVSAVSPLIPGFTPSPLAATQAISQTSVPDPEVYASRPPYQPGEMVEYTAQTGDTLPALAARFNTTISEIRTANPIIPNSATTMPPGMPMKIPIYFRPLWGNPYQIIPDSLFINGPAQRGFNTEEFVDRHPGWLKNTTDWVGNSNRRGGEIVDFVATEYSVSPRLLLAISEYFLGALSDPNPPASNNTVITAGAENRMTGYYRQIAWLADTLNAGYYSWRVGGTLEMHLSDGRIERPDPWQNAATVSLQNYFNQVLPAKAYHLAISEYGLAKTYRELFGDPWQNMQPHLPGSLDQPPFNFPFEPGKIWAYTGGPHSAWGEDAAPQAAVDFAPPSVKSGCQPSDEWVTAVADGVIVRTGTGIALLDLDSDGDERTGWVVFYLHLETSSIPPIGTHLKAGDRMGHPSCEGGHATGTHVHIARKYNGEWVLTGWLVPFNFEGWIVHNGTEPYLGTLTHNSEKVIACTCSDSGSFVQSHAQVTRP